MSKVKIEFLLDIIQKSHYTFREFLVHLPEDILSWKLHKYVNTTRWLIQHIIHDQMWIVNVIMNNNEEGKHFEKESEKLSLEDLIKKYDKFTSKTEAIFKNLEDKILKEIRSHKEYQMTVEDLFFEYIHHLNQHAGEIALYFTIWKREQRAIID